MRKYLIIMLMTCVQQTGWSQIDPSDTKQLMSEYVKSQPDTNRIKLLLRIAECFFYKLRIEDRMDSVELYLSKAQKLNNQLRIATYQNTINFMNAKRHSILNPYDDPQVVFMPVINQCRKTADKKTEMLAWIELGYRISYDSLSLSYKQSCYQHALKLAKELNDYPSEFRVEIYLSYMKLFRGGNPLDDQLGLLRRIKSPDLTNEMLLYFDLSVTYSMTGEYEKSLSYLQKQLNLLGVTRDSTFARHAFWRISQIYRMLGKPTEATEWAKTATDFFTGTMIPGVYNELDQIILMFIQQGRYREGLEFIKKQIARKKPGNQYDQRKIHGAFANIYEHLEMYDLAETNYLELYRLANEQKGKLTKDDMGFICSGIGSFYFKKGEYKKAVPYLEESLKNYQELRLVPHTMNTLKWLIKVDSALGNYDRAFNYLKLRTSMSDSVFTADRNRQIEKLTVSYKTEQKSDSIKILQQTQQLVQLQLRQTKATQNWVIAGAGMLFIITGLLFRQGQLRKRTNKLIHGKNTQLQHLVNEKEWLVKEIHHRVKNNLQIVISLLNSQSAYIKNDAALNAINDSQHRVHAMSLIHQKLYGSENVSSIDMDVYVRELVTYLRDSFDTRHRIRFELNIEPLQMDVSQAVPLGLILNEAITNSIKYAFPADRKGVILISLSHNLANHYVLSITDNGVGLMADPKKTGSLGMSLMKGLSEDLDGNFSIENSNGTTVKVSFVYDPSIKNHDATAATFISNN